jgi:hypothetical protein
VNAVKKAHAVLKVAAIVNALLLVGGCVGYRAGAFDWFSKSDKPTDTSGKNTAVNANQIDYTQPIMTGSKAPFAGVVGPAQDTPGVQPPAQPQSPPDTKQSPPIIMSGTKSSYGPALQINFEQPLLLPSPSPSPSPSK